MVRTGAVTNVSQLPVELGELLPGVAGPLLLPPRHLHVHLPAVPVDPLGGFGVATQLAAGQVQEVGAVVATLVGQRLPHGRVAGLGVAVLAVAGGQVLRGLATLVDVLQLGDAGLSRLDLAVLGLDRVPLLAERLGFGVGQGALLGGRRREDTVQLGLQRGPLLQQLGQLLTQELQHGGSLLRGLESVGSRPRGRSGGGPRWWRAGARSGVGLRRVGGRRRCGVTG
jgi:hypothetical protein